MENQNETKLCKHCKTEIPKEAKVCPNCRKKQGGKLKWIIIIIVVIFVFALASGGKDSQEKEGVNNTEQQKGETSEGSEESSQTEEAKTEETEVIYTAYTVNQMVEDLDKNAMKASEIYKDQYIEITGKLSNIDSSGKYINLHSDDEFAFVGVQCYIQNDEQKEIVKNMTIGDMVTLRGKCTDVGEVLGYSLYIDSINQ